MNDQVMFVKKQMFELFANSYKTFTEFVQKMPINQEIKKLALTRFDEGFFWCKEGISIANFDIEKIDQSQVKQDVEEIKPKEEEKSEKVTEKNEVNQA